MFPDISGGNGPSPHPPIQQVQDVLNGIEIRQQRRLCAQTHRRWTRQDWQKVLFDESRFCLTRGDGQIRVYHRRNERYTAACTLERDRFGGGGSVMVWGSVSQHHQTELVVIAGNLNAVRYREESSSNKVAFLQGHPDMTLQA